MPVASMFPYDCGEAGWFFSRKTPPFLRALNHTTQAEEPKIHTRCIAGLLEHPACTVDNPPNPHLGLKQWQMEITLL